MGHDERDRELPRSGLAVALHHVVPGAPDERVLERGSRGLGHHDGPLPRPCSSSRSYRSCDRIPRWSRVYRADLAAPLPGARADLTSTCVRAARSVVGPRSSD